LIKGDDSILLFQLKRTIPFYLTGIEIWAGTIVKKCRDINMNGSKYSKKANVYLKTLCSVKPNRRIGSRGNGSATEFFERTVKSWGYVMDTMPFDCLDFVCGKVSLACNGNSFDIHISPYSLGCDVTAELVIVSIIEELEKNYCTGKILLMKGEICAEQLMPKNFFFYNPERHKKIYAILEEKQPAAIITATTRNPELVDCDRLIEVAGSIKEYILENN